MQYNVRLYRLSVTSCTTSCFSLTDDCCMSLLVGRVEAGGGVNATGIPMWCLIDILIQRERRNVADLVVCTIRAYASKNGANGFMGSQMY